MDITSLIDFQKDSNRSGDSTNAFSHNRIDTTVYDSIYPPIRSGQNNRDDAQRTQTKDPDQLPAIKASGDPGRGGMGGLPMMNPHAGEQAPAGEETLLSLAARDENAIKEAVEIIRRNPEDFSKLVDEKWDLIDLDRDGYLSQSELSGFLKQPDLTWKNRSMATFLNSNHDMVKNLYEYEETQYSRYFSQSNSQPNKGISHKDIYVLAKALDPNASHDPYKSAFWKQAGLYGGLLFGFGALAGFVAGPKGAALGWGVRTAMALTTGTILGAFGAGLGAWDSYSGRKGTGKNYYRQKQEGINLMLDRAVSSNTKLN